MATEIIEPSRNQPVDESDWLTDPADAGTATNLNTYRHKKLLEEQLAALTAEFNTMLKEIYTDDTPRTRIPIGNNRSTVPLPETEALRSAYLDKAQKLSDKLSEIQHTKDQIEELSRLPGYDDTVRPIHTSVPSELGHLATVQPPEHRRTPLTPSEEDDLRLAAEQRMGAIVDRYSPRPN